MFEFYPNQLINYTAQRVDYRRLTLSLDCTVSWKSVRVVWYFTLYCSTFGRPWKLFSVNVIQFVLSILLDGPHRTDSPTSTVLMRNRRLSLSPLFISFLSIVKKAYALSIWLCDGIQRTLCKLPISYTTVYFDCIAFTVQSQWPTVSCLIFTQNHNITPLPVKKKLRERISTIDRHYRR